MGKDSSIPDTHKAPTLHASIDPFCSLETTAAALLTKDTEYLTWDYVFSILVDEYDAKQSLGTDADPSSKISNRRRKKEQGGNHKPKLISPTQTVIGVRYQKYGGRFFFCSFYWEWIHAWKHPFREKSTL